MPVRVLTEKDHSAWLHMRRALWPGGGSDTADVRRWLVRRDAVTLIAETAAGIPVGFAEAGERAYADGCHSSPVAFLEGWYVVAEHQNSGWGAALVQAVVGWARSRRLTELASDSLLANDTAIAAHLRIGFQEVERSVKFRLDIEGLE